MPRPRTKPLPHVLGGSTTATTPYDKAMTLSPFRVHPYEAAFLAIILDKETCREGSVQDRKKVIDRALDLLQESAEAIENSTR